MRVNWKNLSKGKPADERGYYRSVEGRFETHPLYRSTVYPDAFCVSDNIKKDKMSFDTIRECKQWADDRVIREMRDEQSFHG